MEGKNGRGGSESEEEDRRIEEEQRWGGFEDATVLAFEDGRRPRNEPRNTGSLWKLEKVRRPILYSLQEQTVLLTTLF